MSLLTRSYLPYTIKRLTGAGGSRVFTTLAGSYYKGFIQPISGNERFNMQKSGEESSHRLYTDYRVDIRKGDQITDRNNTIYTVVFAEQADGITGFKKHKEILLRKFK